MATIPSTITDQISEVEGLEISYRVLHPKGIIIDKQTGTEIQFPYSSLTNKYRDYLSNIIISITLDDAQQVRYRFKPKMVSLELYGTVEFWDDILILNNYTSVMEFQPQVLKYYDPQLFKKYLNEIMIIEGIVS